MCSLCAELAPTTALLPTPPTTRSATSNAGQTQSNGIVTLTSVGCYNEAFCSNGNTAWSFPNAVTWPSGPYAGLNTGFTPFTCAQTALALTATPDNSVSNLVIGVMASGPPGGGTCWYGTSLADVIAAGPSTACTLSCNQGGIASSNPGLGDPKQICGGSCAQSVFTVG